jgi:hypothetical protein
VAVDLNIFDALAGSQSQGKGKTASQLSSELSLMQDRVNRFLRALVSLGLLELRDDGKTLVDIYYHPFILFEMFMHNIAQQACAGFHNTAASEVYLVSTSPLCVTDAVQFMRYTTGFYHDELTAVLQGKGHLDNESYGQYVIALLWGTISHSHTCSNPL